MLLRQEDRGVFEVARAEPLEADRLQRRPTVADVTHVPVRRVRVHRHGRVEVRTRREGEGRARARIGVAAADPRIAAQSVAAADPTLPGDGVDGERHGGTRREVARNRAALHVVRVGRQGRGASDDAEGVRLVSHILDARDVVVRAHPEPGIRRARGRQDEALHEPLARRDHHRDRGRTPRRIRVVADRAAPIVRVAPVEPRDGRHVVGRAVVEEVVPHTVRADARLREMVVVARLVAKADLKRPAALRPVDEAHLTVRARTARLADRGSSAGRTRAPGPDRQVEGVARHQLACGLAEHLLDERAASATAAAALRQVAASARSTAAGGAAGKASRVRCVGRRAASAAVRASAALSTQEALGDDASAASEGQVARAARDAADATRTFGGVAGVAALTAIGDEVAAIEARCAAARRDALRRVSTRAAAAASAPRAPLKVVDVGREHPRVVARRRIDARRRPPADHRARRPIGVEVQPEAVGAVGAGVLLRHPLVVARVELPERARVEHLSVDELDVGDEPVEISGRRGEVHLPDAMALRPVDAVLDVLRDRGVRAPRRDLFAVQPYAAPLLHVGVRRVVGDDDMIPSVLVAQHPRALAQPRGIEADADGVVRAEADGVVVPVVIVDVIVRAEDDLIAAHLAALDPPAPRPLAHVPGDGGSPRDPRIAAAPEAQALGDGVGRERRAAARQEERMRAKGHQAIPFMSRAVIALGAPPDADRIE